MANLMAQLRPYVERWPGVARSYRYLRDRCAFVLRDAEATPFGFRLKGNHLMASGGFEPEQTKLMVGLMRESDAFVDVGANIGYYTCHAAGLGKPVAAVEPLPENLEYLRENIRANGFQGITVHETVLGETRGEAVLHGASTGASLISGWAEMSPLLKRTVPMDTLDGLLDGRFEGKRLFIKIDVEGAELGVLKGALKTLSRLPPPAWIVEIGNGELHPDHRNSNFEETFAVFWRYGYTSHLALPEKPEIKADDVRQWVQSGCTPPGNENYLFMKKA